MDGFLSLTVTLLMGYGLWLTVMRSGQLLDTPATEAPERLVQLICRRDGCIATGGAILLWVMLDVAAGTPVGPIQVLFIAALAFMVWQTDFWQGHIVRLRNQINF